MRIIELTEESQITLVFALKWWQHLIKGRDTKMPQGMVATNPEHPDKLLAGQELAALIEHVQTAGEDPLYTLYSLSTNSLLTTDLFRSEDAALTFRGDDPRLDDVIPVPIMIFQDKSEEPVEEGPEESQDAGQSNTSSADPPAS